MNLTGRGTNNLIKKGASLVTSPEDIFNYLNIPFNKNVETKVDPIFIKSEFKQLYNLITQNPISVSELSIKTGLDIINLNQKLTLMELEGYIKSLPGNKFVRL